MNYTNTLDDVYYVTATQVNKQTNRTNRLGNKPSKGKNEIFLTIASLIV